MAYREHGMQEILNVLRRFWRGETKSQIARVTGHNRSTVRRWIGVAEELGWVRSFEPDEALASEVWQGCQPGDRSRVSATKSILDCHQKQLMEWLHPEQGDGLQLKKVEQLLSKMGVEVSYTNLYRYARSELGFGRKPRVTVRVAECAAGEVAEVDFGKLGPVWDPEKQRRRVAWALIVTLAHSRHQYVHVSFSQAVPDLIEGLEDAWDFFGGVPAKVVIDNMKSAVVKPDRYDPFFQRTFEEYAEYRGFVIDAAPVRTPTGKPKVERNVQYLRESFYRGEDWLDLDHLQRSARKWCIEIAGERVHGTTRQRPIAVFESVERVALRPIAKERFDPPVWGKCKVHCDHHIVFGKALYSVPTRWVGTEVEVQGNRSLVRIFAGGKLIKTHGREPAGGRSTDYNDYPAERAPYAMRDPDRMVSDAKLLGSDVGRFMAQLLAGPCPWARLRQAQKLLRMATKYGNEKVDSACARALAFDLIDVRRVERIVIQGLERPGRSPSPATGELLALPLTGRFLRPARSFIEDKRNKEKKHGDQTIAHHDTETASAVGNSGDSARPGSARSQDENG